MQSENCEIQYILYLSYELSFKLNIIYYLFDIIITSFNFLLQNKNNSFITL